MSNRAPFLRFEEKEVETFLVRIKDVVRQNHYGALFNCDLIDDQGEPQEFLGDYFQVSAPARGLATPVKRGQWWQVKGKKHYTEYADRNRGGLIRYGTLLKVETNGSKMIMPSGSAIVDYIAMHPDMSAVAKDKALKLWEKFQERLFDILNNSDVETLSQVKGLSKEVCERIVRAWKTDGLGYQLQWLQHHNIPLSIGRKALSYFGERMKQTVEENPYVLLPFSASWRPVDRIALDVAKIGKDDPRRLEAAVHEACYRRMSEGHTFVNRKWLLSALRKTKGGLLSDLEEGVDDKISEALRLSYEGGRLFFDSEGHAYPIGACLLENNIVDAIKVRRSLENCEFDVSGLIHDYEHEQGRDFTLNAEQRKAVLMVAENNFSILTGGAGCGKTTVLNVVRRALEQQGYEIVQLALAGKAARRMFEATGYPAYTIASYVCSKSKDKRKDEKQNSLIKEHPVAVIIDEASMLDLLAMNRLLEFIPKLCKIVLVGDPNQLPPVGPGLILHALTQFDKVAHTQLKVANRFGGEILEVAESVLNGLFPQKFHDSVSFVECGEHEMAEKVAAFYLSKREGSIVLCARRKEVKEINSILQRSITAQGKQLRVFDDDLGAFIKKAFFLNDPVICVSNRYDYGLQNGSMGHIIELFDEPRLLDSDSDLDEPALGWILWDDGEVRPIRETLLDDIQLGYALTVHKAQGSQWPHVILAFATPMGPLQSKIMDKSLVYTAITRAQKKVSIFGRHEHFCEATKKSAVDYRDTAMLKRLQTQILH